MPAILLALLLSIAALAQSSAGGGSIQGTVKDPTGAVLPGAKLAIRHQASGLTTSTVTNAEGFFVTPPLNIGLYKVRVEMTGMKAWEGELTLETGKIAVIEPVLTPGQVTETVQVTDEDLKKEYDDRVGPMKNAEYRAKHILVETEAAAKEVIAKIQVASF